VDRLLLSFAAAPLVFAVCAFATRASTRRVAAAPAGSTAFAAGTISGGVLACTADSVIVFGPGAAPWLAGAIGCLTLMALALSIQLALGGDARRLR
jgi:hypothetical protein